MVKIKLSEILGRKRISQRELAAGTNIRSNTINSYYNETCKYLAVEHIDKICKFLNCNITDLIEFENDRI